MLLPQPETLLESLSNPVLLVDRDQCVVFANQAACLFWRTTRIKLDHYPLGRLFAEEPVILRAVELAVFEERASTINHHPFQHQGQATPLMLRVQVNPLLEGANPVALAMVQFWDISRLEQKEEQNREKGVREAMGVMVGRLAHELQNPLSGIKGATQLLQRELGRDDEDVYAKIILKELDRLERLVKNLLAQGGEPPLNKTTFNLHELLDTVIWFVENGQSKPVIKRVYDPSLPEITADRDRLHQVALNLLLNAVDAGESGQEVVVETSLAHAWQLEELPPEQAASFYQIQVKDRGPGVDPDKVARLFTPFFSTKKNGNGLGLSLSMLITRAHRGQLRYQPNPGGGAVFSVLLPLGEAKKSGSA